MIFTGERINKLIPQKDSFVFLRAFFSALFMVKYYN